MQLQLLRYNKRTVLKISGRGYVETSVHHRQSKGTNYDTPLANKTNLRKSEAISTRDITRDRRKPTTWGGAKEFGLFEILASRRGNFVGVQLSMAGLYLAALYRVLLESRAVIQRA